GDKLIDRNLENKSSVDDGESRNPGAAQIFRNDCKSAAALAVHAYNEKIATFGGEIEDALVSGMNDIEIPGDKNDFTALGPGQNIVDNRGDVIFIFRHAALLRRSDFKSFMPIMQRPAILPERMPSMASFIVSNVKCSVMRDSSRNRPSRTSPR